MRLCIRELMKHSIQLQQTKKSLRWVLRCSIYPFQKYFRVFFYPMHEAAFVLNLINMIRKIPLYVKQVLNLIYSRFIHDDATYPYDRKLNGFV